MTKKLVKFSSISLESLAALVSEKMKEHNLNCVLVGGSCVSLYSKNRYQSYDLDFVTQEDMTLVANALNELGFHKKAKYFSHPDCEFFIEFVSPPVAVGKEPIIEFEDHKTKLGHITMLTATDCIKDRLASYYHWDDKQALEQALLVFNAKANSINLKDIKKWSKQEGYSEKYLIFLRLTKNS